MLILDLLTKSQKTGKISYEQNIQLKVHFWAFTQTVFWFFHGELF